MDQSMQVVQQASMILSHVEYELPVHHLADGTVYILVIALYEMLGLRMLCGIWTVCTCCQDGFYRNRQERSLVLQEGRCLWGILITLLFEVSTQNVQLRGTSNGREDLYPE